MSKYFRKIVSVCLPYIAIFLLLSCSNSKISEKDLEGLWILKNMNGVSVSEFFKGNKPNLEFNFEKNMIHGYAGCNRFSSVFTLEGNELKVENIASTKMLCTEINQEDEFFMTLSKDGGLLLEVENEILFFKEKDNSHIVFEFEKERSSSLEKTKNEK